MAFKKKFDISQKSEQFKKIQEEIAEREEGYDAVDGLLGDSMINFPLRQIKVSEIVRSEDNFYSIEEDGIENLAESILDVGIINPPCIKEEKGKWVIVAGERRITACKKLIKDGKWSADMAIPCFIFTPALINLPLSDAQKEQYIRVTENLEQREKTDADKIEELRVISGLYDVLKKEHLIRGGRRKFIATELKMSEGQVQSLMDLTKPENVDILAMVEKDALSVTAATNIQKKLTPKQRKDFLEENKDRDKIQNKDIDTFLAKENLKKSRRKAAAPDGESVSLTPKEFRKSLKGIQTILEENEIILGLDDYAAFRKNVEAIERIVKKYI